MTGKSFFLWCNENNKNNLLNLWDKKKNEKSPKEVSYSSQKKYYFKCSKGHEWQEYVYTLIKKNGCPYCNKRKVCKEYNLAIVKPKVAALWDYEKNFPVKPEEVYPSGSDKYWWKCPNGHSFQRKLNSIQGDVNRCPYCTHKKISPKYNLKTVFPYIVEEWDYEKNALGPENYHPRSSKKVHWICRINKEHRWEASISNRTKPKPNGCPHCKNELKTSFPEQAIFYYLSKAFSKCHNRFNILGKEVDIYIEEINLAIEYDGIYRHSSDRKIEADKEKEKILRKNNVNFLRIKETLNQEQMISLNGNVILCKIDGLYKYVDNMIKSIMDYIEKEFKIKKNINPDVKKDFISINKQYLSLVKENSFAVCSKELLEEWDSEKNQNISPYVISRGSGKRFWWKCKKNHSWKTSVLHRTHGQGCPYCNGSKITYERSLAARNPKLSKLWDYTKNDGLTPRDVFSWSDKKIWWKCPKGHSWQNRINDARKTNECPYCEGRKITKENNFGVLFPELLKEWDWEANTVSPFEISKANNNYFHWKCAKGHKWKARLSNRTVLKRKCPYCAHRLVTVEDSIASIEKLKNEWHPTKNVPLKAEETSKYSNKKVWWKCSRGHEWQSFVGNRTKGYGNCQECKKNREIDLENFDKDR